MSHCRGATSAIVLAISFSGGGAVRASESVELSLEQAVARAETQSPLVRLAIKQRETTEAQRTGAALVMPSNPFVVATVGGRDDASPSLPAAKGFEWGLRLEQSIEVGGQRGTRLAEVAKNVDVALARERLARIETRARVRAAYFALLLASANVESAREREALGARVLASAQARVSEGAAAEVEVQLAQAEQGRLLHDRIEAELVLGAASATLAWLIDLPVATTVTPTTPLAEPPEVAEPLAQLQASAHMRRAELHALRATRSSLDATIMRLRREAIPNPTLFVEFQRTQPGQYFFGGGVGLPLPLFRQNQGELAQVRAIEARTEEELRVLERELEAEVASTYRAALARRQEMKVWNEIIVPATDRNVALVSEGWQAGKFDLFRVVQVLREAADARRRQLEALGTLWQAVIELDRATGAP